MPGGERLAYTRRMRMRRVPRQRAHPTFLVPGQVTPALSHESHGIHTRCGQRAGLVEHDRPDLRQVFQHQRVLHKYVHARQQPLRRAHREGRRQRQRTGTSDDEHGCERRQPPGGVAPEGPENRRAEGNGDDDVSEAPAVAIGERIEAGVAAFLERLVIPERREVALRHGLHRLQFDGRPRLLSTGVKIVALSFLDRFGFAGDKAVVNQSRPTDEFRVSRNQFAVADDDAVTDLELRNGDAIFVHGRPSHAMRAGIYLRSSSGPRIA